MQNLNPGMRLLPVLGLWLIAALAGYAQQASDFSFQHLTSENGLSNDHITCMLKDRRGFMWFGTASGLNRFDGISCKVFKKDGRNGLAGNKILGLTEDADGWIWVSTQSGLCRFHPGSERFQSVALPDKNHAPVVSQLMLQGREYAWFSTLEHVYRIHLPTLRVRLFPCLGDPVSRHEVQRIFPDRAGRIWAMQYGALYRLDPATGTYTYHLGRDITHLQTKVLAQSLYEDRKGKLWLSTWEAGLLTFEKDHFEPVPGTFPFASCVLEYEAPGGDRLLLGGGGTNGLFLYLPGSGRTEQFVQHSRDDFSHNNSQVTCLYADRQTGMIWVGTEQGIEKVDPMTIFFKRILIPPKKEEASLSFYGQFSIVTAIRQDRTDPARFFIGLWGKGLLIWNRAKQSFSWFNEGLSDNEIIDVLQSRGGQLYVAAKGALDEWDPASQHWRHWKDFYHTPGIQHRIVAILEDEAGMIWLGSSYDGLFVLDPKTGSIRAWTFPGQAYGIGKRFQVYRMTEDRYRRLWVLTSGGLFRLDAARTYSREIRLTGISEAFMPSDLMQTALKIDSEENLWVSDAGRVLRADLDGRVTRVYTAKEGLQSDYVHGIEEDREGRLWMTTDNFLHRLDPATQTFRYFRKDNGLFGNASSNVITRASTGELFVGFTEAINYFLPEQVRPNPVAPVPVVTDVRIGNRHQDIVAGEAVTIRPEENAFTLSFVGLNYSQPEKNTYAYRLDGFDTDWTTTSARTATYTNLEPGTYTFRLRTANNDGRWNDQMTQLEIRIIPPYYKTTWFRTLGILLLAGLAYGVYRYREGQRRRLEAVRERIATDLHDDMGSTLSSIRIFSDVAQAQINGKVPEALPLLQRISHSATALSESMQDIIWTIQTRHNSLEDVVTRMREFGLRMTEARGIAFRMDVSEKFSETRLNVEQRRNIYLIFKESLNNAVKYAECREVTVSLSASYRRLALTIRDDGKGFDRSTIRTGNGLPNLEKRAREIKGTLTVTSAPGEGTRIELRMPFT